MTELDAKIIISYAECNMSIRAVADKLRYHYNTIDYHLAKIKRITGLDPKNFFDLHRLYMTAREFIRSKEVQI